MPKLKTHKGIAKRVKITGKGKVKRKKMGKNHFLTKKDSSRKRELQKYTVQEGAQGKELKRALPYG